jgi:NAD-dependent deacetylase
VLRVVSVPSATVVVCGSNMISWMWRPSRPGSEIWSWCLTSTTRGVSSCFQVEPNAAHRALVELESKYDVHIITQNVDDLHERAGSTNVMHLHGELKKARSTVDDSLIYELDGWELKPGDLCEKGSQLRPHIVWFGEMVPMIPAAATLSSEADIYLIIGTSLNVYPAAGLVEYVSPGVPVYLIDPGELGVSHIPNLTFIQEKAGTGTPELVVELLKQR